MPVRVPDRRDPDPVNGQLEINWTVAPFVGGLGLVVLGVFLFPVVLSLTESGRAVPQARAPSATPARAVAAGGARSLPPAPAQPAPHGRRRDATVRPPTPSIQSAAKVAKSSARAAVVQATRCVLAPDIAASAPSAGQSDPPSALGAGSSFAPRRVEFRSLADERLTEALRKEVPEVDLVFGKKEADAFHAAALRAGDPGRAGALLDLVARRPDLRGLPVTRGKTCQARADAASWLTTLGPPLRQLVDRAVRDGGPDGYAFYPAHFDDALRSGMVAPVPPSRGRVFPPPRAEDWLRTEAVPTLMQILQAEDRPFRLSLVGQLWRIQSPEATAALVRLALFDVSAEVRIAALLSVQDRPTGEYRQLLDVQS